MNEGLSYNYERCENNSKAIEMLEKKIGEIMVDMHKIDLLNQKTIDFIDRYENDKNSQKVEKRWMIGLMITSVLGIASILVAVIGKLLF